MSPDVAPRKHIVLLGLGHTNAQVVRAWRDRPIAGARLTCVSDFPRATYSGMLPGVLAGQYRREQMEIDLARLCAAAGATLITAGPRGLDVAGRRLLLDDGRALAFDALSVGVGSTVSMGGVRLVPDAPVVPVKPMQTFVDRLDAVLGAVRSRGDRRVAFVVVGAGAAGVELALCLPWHLQRVLGDVELVSQALVDAGDRTVPGSLDATRRRVDRLLRRRGVEFLPRRRVDGIESRSLRLDAGRDVEADLVVWATGAAPPAMLGSLGLPRDERGFLLTDDTLRSVAGVPVFAVGDCGSVAGAAVPKAGVHAVRQGPVLWANLQRVLDGAPLRRYRPQRDFLKLINTGDGRALGEWRGVSFEGAWCWRLKDVIDRRFIRRYQVIRSGRFSHGSLTVSGRS